MDPTSDFQKVMVEYLKTCHNGELLNGNMKTMAKKMEESKASNPTKVPLTEFLSNPPPLLYQDEHEDGAECLQCNKYEAW